MIFADLSDEARKRAIRFLEESLFGAHTVGAHYFQDVPPPMPGFMESTHVRSFKVTVAPTLFKG